MEDNEPLNVILDVVMVNVDFHLGFDVDLQKLDKVLQNEEDEFYTIYDTPVNTSVNIKFDYSEPDAVNYQKIVIEGTPEKPTFRIVTTNACPKAKVKDTMTHTFLVFSSSKVIQSGRYYNTEMEPIYKKFHDLIDKYRKKVELKLHDNKFDMTKLMGLKKGAINIRPLANPKIHL